MFPGVKYTSIGSFIICGIIVRHCPFVAPELVTALFALNRARARAQFPVDSFAITSIIRIYGVFLCDLSQGKFDRNIVH